VRSRAPAILAGAYAVLGALSIVAIFTGDTDASFRTRDATLLGRLAELEGRCGRSMSSSRERAWVWHQLRVLA
jgi:hypothetical protein